MQDEERMKKAVNKIPTPAELNRLLARTPREVDLFDKLDAQPDWPVLSTGEGLLLAPERPKRTKHSAPFCHFQPSTTQSLKWHQRQCF